MYFLVHKYTNRHHIHGFLSQIRQILEESFFGRYSRARSQVLIRFLFEMHKNVPERSGRDKTFNHSPEFFCLECNIHVRRDLRSAWYQGQFSPGCQISKTNREREIQIILSLSFLLFWLFTSDRKTLDD